MAKSTLKNDLDLSSHNGSTAGLKLGGTLVTATAAELNKGAGVTAGTVTASKALVVDSNKDLAALRNLTVTNLDAGASATAGTVDIFPTTAAKGKVALTAADSAGDTTTTIVNASQAGARTYTIPDGGASANFVLDAGTTTMAAASRIKLDNGTVTLSANAGTLSKQAGVVTTEALTTAGGASQALVITNTLVATTSAIVLTKMGGTNTVKNYSLEAVPTANTITVTVYNNTAATALNGTIIFSVTVVN